MAWRMKGDAAGIADRCHSQGELWVPGEKLVHLLLADAHAHAPGFGGQAEPVVGLQGWRRGEHAVGWDEPEGDVLPGQAQLLEDIGLIVRRDHLGVFDILAKECDVDVRPARALQGGLQRGTTQPDHQQRGGEDRQELFVVLAEPPHHGQRLLKSGARPEAVTDHRQGPMRKQGKTLWGQRLARFAG
jgi:hypothetical protein